MSTPLLNLIDGRAIAEQIHVETAQRTAALKAKGIEAGLAFIRVGEDPASKVYVGMKGKMCARLGPISGRGIVVFGAGQGGSEPSGPPAPDAEARLQEDRSQVDEDNDEQVARPEPRRLDEFASRLGPGPTRAAPTPAALEGHRRCPRRRCGRIRPCHCGASVTGTPGASPTGHAVAEEGRDR